MSHATCRTLTLSKHVVQDYQPNGSGTACEGADDESESESESFVLMCDLLLICEIVQLLFHSLIHCAQYQALFDAPIHS